MLLVKLGFVIRVVESRNLLVIVGIIIVFASIIFASIIFASIIFASLTRKEPRGSRSSGVLVTGFLTSDAPALGRTSSFGSTPSLRLLSLTTRLSPSLPTRLSLPTSPSLTTRLSLNIVRLRRFLRPWTLQATKLLGQDLDLSILLAMLLLLLTPEVILLTPEFLHPPLNLGLHAPLQLRGRVALLRTQDHPPTY